MTGRLGCLLCAALAPPAVATGLSREEFVFDNATSPVAARLTYPAADLDPAHAKLSLRRRADDPRQTPPGLAFSYMKGSEEHHG